MRKFILIVAAVLMLGVIPAMAQDEMGTIADIVVASSTAETPEFTVLLAAVSAADPSVLAELSDPEENYTVFAPTDAAFAAALEALGMTAEELLADTATLTTILSYHLVPVTLLAEDVIALDGALVGTVYHEGALAISLGEGTVMVNEATVVSPDVMASNGVVHVIDSVLVPPSVMMMMSGEMVMTEEPMMATEEPMMEPMGSIADVVVASTEAEAPEFTVLLAAVAAADPAILSELSNGGPFTVFAPTDAAFAAALEALGVTAEELLADTATLTAVLAYHVVPGHFSAETVVAVAGVEGGVNVATALNGTTVNVAASDAGVTVNGANVVATDVHASNGIIHVIDAVILPPTE
jgi:uncharacterized surface protein with fasciclin (FAS1) repeats